MADKKTTKKIIKKKKKWVKIMAPKAFKEAILGESPVFESENLIGRTIKVNLMSLLKDPRKQNLSVSFKVTKIEGDVARTEAVGYEVLPSMIKRLVKRRKQKVEDSFVCKTKDGKKIRVKPLVIANSKVTKTVTTSIRAKLKFIFGTVFEKTTLEDFLIDMILGKSLLKLKDQIKKIYPVKTLEIKKISVSKDSVVAINPKDERYQKHDTE